MAASIPSEPGTIAVLGGTGPEGSGLVRRWVRAGMHVLIGSRSADRASEAARAIRERAGGAVSLEGYSNRDAADRADTIVLAVPFAAQQALIKEIESALQPGKVVVDITVPLATAVGGRPTALLGVWQGSAAQQTAASVPKGVVVVSAFHNVPARHLEEIEHAVECDVLVCGDNREGKARVRILVEAIEGCRYVDAGPLANSRIVESVTALLVGINIRYKVPGAGIRLTGIE